MSGRKALLDTNIVIDLLAGEETVVDILSELDELLIPVVVVGELYYGAENSERREHHIEKVRTFLSKCSIIHLDEKVAEQYGRVKKELKDKGKPIPENDVWIASIAKTLDTQLISNDAHFRELEIELLSPDH